MFVRTSNMIVSVVLAFRMYDTLFVSSHNSSASLTQLFRRDDQACDAATASLALFRGSSIQRQTEPSLHDATAAVYEANNKTTKSWYLYVSVITITDRPSYTAVDGRRPSFSDRRCPSCLERTTTPRYVCTVSHWVFWQSPPRHVTSARSHTEFSGSRLKDLPFQPFLYILAVVPVM